MPKDFIIVESSFLLYLRFKRKLAPSASPATIMVKKPSPRFSCAACQATDYQPNGRCNFTTVRKLGYCSSFGISCRRYKQLKSREIMVSTAKFGISLQFSLLYQSSVPRQPKELFPMLLNLLATHPIGRKEKERINHVQLIPRPSL